MSLDNLPNKPPVSAAQMLRGLDEAMRLFHPEYWAALKARREAEALEWACRHNDDGETKKAKRL